MAVSVNANSLRKKVKLPVTSIVFHAVKKQKAVWSTWEAQGLCIKSKVRVKPKKEGTQWQIQTIR